jgi:hypothetical protein
MIELKKVSVRHTTTNQLKFLKVKRKKIQKRRRTLRPRQEGCVERNNRKPRIRRIRLQLRAKMKTMIVKIVAKSPKKQFQSLPQKKTKRLQKLKKMLTI